MYGAIPQQVIDDECENLRVWGSRIDIVSVMVITGLFDMVTFKT